MDNIREIKQLWYVAKFYFEEAYQIEEKLDNSFLDDTIGAWCNECEKKNINDYAEIHDKIIFTAHLGSICIRLESIECSLISSRKIKYDDIKKRVIKKKSLKEYIDYNTCKQNEHCEHCRNPIIHILMRHKLAHSELGEKYKLLNDHIFKHTIRELYHGIQKAFIAIKRDYNIISLPLPYPLNKL